MRFIGSLVFKDGRDTKEDQKFKEREKDRVTKVDQQEFDGAGLDNLGRPVI